MYRIVAFTGAGISKASGIPTFAEMGDLREKLSRDYFNRYTEDFYRILNQMRRTCDQAKPNPAHLAIARYDVPVVTMNIDGLHKRAGSTNIVEIHGCLDYLYCDCCQKRYSYDVLEESIYCKSCHEKLQPNVVLYGDNIPLYSEAAKLVTNTKELLVIFDIYVIILYNDFIKKRYVWGIMKDVKDEGNGNLFHSGRDGIVHSNILFYLCIRKRCRNGIAKQAH
jgi:NAD-dependent deacetylase